MASRAVASGAVSTVPIGSFNVFDGTDWWIVQVMNPGDGVRLRS